MARTLPARTFGMFAAAAAVGALGGLLGVGFQTTIVLLQNLAVGPGGPENSIVAAGAALEPWRRILVPTVGGIVAGLLLVVVARYRGPFGITDVLELVVTRRGTIHAPVSLVQILSSATSIATGSSIGKEGPNSQIGATIAASLARLFRVSSRTKAVLLGCGVAAGMTASYNAPIAGALFVMEVVLGNFAMDVFAPIVVAAVMSSLVVGEFLPRVPIYASAQKLTDPRLVLSALLLGLLCAFGSLAFRKLLDLVRSGFQLARLPPPIALGLGGAAVGAIGIWRPEVWGNGYDTLKMILGEVDPTATNPLPPALSVVFVLLFAKSLATSISVGSGALGGIFTPNLVVGGALGAVFGYFVHSLWPAAPGGDPRIAFALVGMAGLCAATAHAPITSVLLIFELTQDYNLILPTMLCAISASLFARMLDADSIFSARLRAKGHDVAAGLEKTTLQQNFVRDLMRKDVVRVTDTTTFDEVMEIVGSTRADSIYVVDPEQRLLGHIDIHDVKNFINDPSLGSVVIAGDLSRPAPTATPDETLAQVLPRFDDPELEELAVIATADSQRLIGRLTRRDVIALLHDEVLRQRHMRARLSSEGQQESFHLELPPGNEMAQVVVPDELVGRAIDSLDLTNAGLTLMLVIDRDESGRERRHPPEPALVLTPGSELVVIGTPEAIAAFRAGAAPES